MDHEPREDGTRQTPCQAARLATYGLGVGLGRKQLLPHFGERRLTAITTFELREWRLELHEAGDYAPEDAQ